MLEKKTLESIVNEITDNYNNEELILFKIRTLYAKP